MATNKTQVNIKGIFKTVDSTEGVVKATRKS